MSYLRSNTYALQNVRFYHFTSFLNGILVHFNASEKSIESC